MREESERKATSSYYTCVLMEAFSQAYGLALLPVLVCGGGRAGTPTKWRHESALHRFCQKVDITTIEQVIEYLPWLYEQSFAHLSRNHVSCTQLHPQCHNPRT